MTARRARGQMSSLVAAAVFAISLAVLLLFVIVKISSLPTRYYLAPASPPQGASARWIHVFSVYYYGQPTLLMVAADTPNPQQALAEINTTGAITRGIWAATFMLWPGGYNCTYNNAFSIEGGPISAENPLKIGPNPYIGLWCPPPWSSTIPTNCAPVNIASEGRILLTVYACH